MSLRVRLPLTKDLRNQGLSDVTVTNNGVTFNSAGKLGGCYSFGGSSQKIVNTLSSTITSSVGSLSCWIKMNSLPGSSGFYNLMQLGNLGGYATCRLGLYMEHTNKINVSIDGSSTGANIYTHSLVANQWYHICATYNGTIVKLYIDGNEVLSKTASKGSYTTAASYLYVGGTSSYYLNGYMNDARYYDHCLSPMEVKQISQGLVLHYPLNNNGFGNENLLSRYVVPGQAVPTSTAAGGRTTWLGDYKITIPATENADTYFRLFTTKQLTANTVYTISCQVSGLKEGSYYRFPLYAQNNNGMGVLNLDHNGLCFLTFTMTYGTQTATTGANGETVYICFMDDVLRNIASGQGAITISNFKLEEGDKVTPWCPSLSDDLATTMGMNDGVEYDCSGFGNNGTRTGAFTWTSDTPKYQVSTHVGATNQKIHISNFPTSGFGNSYSFAWWGKRNNNPMFWGFSDGIRLNGMFTGTLWNTGDSSNNPIYKPNTTTTITAPTVNVWHHYVMTGDGTTCKLYLDGELYGQAKTYKAISGTSIWINGWDSGTSYCSDNTDISDFRIYATALSADDVRSLYQNSAYIDSSGNVYGAVHEEV